MIQVDSYKRPSPSPSRSSVRSDNRVFRQPRVIQVNRDASTMVEGAGGAESAGDPGCSAAQDWDPRHQAAHFRSRTFSDGFIRNTSLELLLGVDCDACLALAAQRHCLDEHVHKQDFDLVCNCHVQQNNLVNCHRDVTQRGHTLNIYDLERIKRDTGRSRLDVGSHRSLDRKFNKSKTIGVSNYISKQLISYDPRSTLVQKIKRKLSNLKKIGGDAISKKHQNAVQLAEITSGSTSSLKKLSMLSLADKPQRRVNSQTCIFSSGLQGKEDVKNTISTYANFSGNVDQCFDRLRDCNSSVDSRPGRGGPKMVKMRSFDNNDELISRHSPALEMKFSTLDNRSRCRSIRRQMSYNEFPNERFRERGGDRWGREECGEGHGEVEEEQAFMDGDVVVSASSLSRPRAHCTCDPRAASRLHNLYYDTHVSTYVGIVCILVHMDSFQ